jgi:hypothetical protein
VIGADDQVAVWVYFTDKGAHEFTKSSVPFDVVSARAIQRRRKNSPHTEVVDYTDLPVDQAYVNEIASRVHRVRQRSRWFNSISVSATKSQIADLETLSFVKRIELLARFKRHQMNDEVLPSDMAGPSSTLRKVGSTNDIDYGLSLNQLSLINVPPVHNTGNFGQGVVVGMFDNGFRLLNHEVFDSLDILATYDFVDHKESVKPNNPSGGFGAHGILTLSQIAGYKPGELIGPAFQATYILARTENDSSETPIEEDNWVAAIEWAESLGVDVTSTSLAYLAYDSPYPSWTWEDMDGNTTVITRAADLAVSKGVVVVNAAGNDGFNASRNTLNAPADGDSVLAVGAVNPDGLRAGYSSVGPTVDGRFKPDVMAQGTLVRAASTSDTTAYGFFTQGTSHSCPLVAGVVALILHDNPDATPMQVVNALRMTATQAHAPDNLNGWGIVDALASVNYLKPSTPPSSYMLAQNFPNPFNSMTTITYDLPQASVVELKIYDLLGREVRTMVDQQQSTSSLSTPHSAIWDGRDNGGNSVASGVYFYRISAVSARGKAGGTFTASKKLVLVK